MTEKGKIKFNCEWVYAEPLSIDKLIEINLWRDKLYELGLIGVYESGPNKGVGYGNVSIRSYPPEHFIITASDTGRMPHLTPEYYTEVVKYDFDMNHVKYQGPDKGIRASSESMSHAAVFESDPTINAVVHVHNLDLWNRLIGKVPTTSRQVEYGTPGMAYEIKRLFEETDVKTSKFFAMGGHEEGLISFGRDMEEAGTVLLKHLE